MSMIEGDCASTGTFEMITPAVVATSNPPWSPLHFFMFG
jgi:hypothetical protein